MRTEHLMNKSLQCYRCASLFGEIKSVMDSGEQILKITVIIHFRIPLSKTSLALFGYQGKVVPVLHEISN
jgi:hypothetical protein